MSHTSFCKCNVGQDCLNSFNAAREIVQSANEEMETGDIDINLPGDSDDGLKTKQ